MPRQLRLRQLPEGRLAAKDWHAKSWPLPLLWMSRCGMTRSQRRPLRRVCAADNELASLISELAQTLQQWLNACL